jgi:hypothetical protein
MTQLTTTPEGFRTAAYLAARARLDAARSRSRSGKTSRSVDCTPPNVRCGGRCIPPSWDCRLKGEGPDPQLRAVKTDPLSGFANIQRGIGRISRGVTRGNFSEVEGGKRAIIRGVVKTVPGDIQQKKQLKATLENRTRAIGVGLAVVTTGLGMHAILMKSNLYGYRQGWGKDINQATRAGVSRVLDSIPVLGTQRRATRAAVGANLGAAAARASAPAMSTSAIPGTTVLSATDRESHSALQQSLNRINGATRSGAAGTSGNLENWNQRHSSAFWNATRKSDITGPGAPARVSIYAEPTAQEYLGKQFGVPPGERSSRSGVKAVLQARFDEERRGLVSLARQQGLQVRGGPNGDTIDSKDINAFVSGVMRSRPIADTAVRQSVEAHVRSVLTKAPSSYTNEVYNASVLSFDSFYKATSRDIRTIPGAAATTGRRIATPLSTGSNELLRNTNTYRSTYLAGEMRARTQMAGPAHSELVQAAYYHTKVVGTNASSYEIPDRLAFNAASELSGRSITSRSEAIGIINRETGFSGARVATTAAPRTAAPRTTGQPRPATRRLRSRSELISRLTKGGLSAEAAAAEADRIIARRGDEDDLPPRVAAYLQMQHRTDAAGEKGLGKPCGASHIPKTYECSKGAAGSTSDNRKKAAIIAAVVGGAVAIGVAGAVAYNVKTISDPSKTPLAPSPNIRDVVKAAKAEAGTKSASEAMGHYYVNKSGLKPGDVVYFRTAKDPSAHFGVYLGPGKDGVVRAVIANTKASRFSWTDVAEIGSIKPGVKTAQAVLTPLVKAPTPQFLQGGRGPYTPEEVVRRAIRISSTDYKFSVTRNNCETLANTIAYGVPKSEQLNRFNRVSKTMVDFTVGRGQRREGERAIFEGRAQGRNYTAADFSKFLEGERAFSSPEGKNLARQYDSYFKGYNLDAQNAPNYLGLISPSELWGSINTYEAPVRAQAMSNYLFALRTLKEMAKS